MNLKQLRSFKAVAETLHFQQAAWQLNLSQPALSHRIKALEDSLQVKLFERNRRGVALTTAGETLLSHVDTILAACDAAVQETRAVAGHRPDLLRIGYIEYLNIAAIAASIARYRALHPEVAVEQRDLPPLEVIEALKQGQLDLGFAVLPVTEPSLAVRPIVEGRWGLVVPSDHPLGGRESLRLEDLEALPLILFRRPLNPRVYDGWLARFRAAGVRANIVFETRQVQSALTMVQAGGGHFLASDYSTSLLPASLRWIPFSGFDATISVGVLWKQPGTTPLIREYLNCLSQALQ